MIRISNLLGRGTINLGMVFRDPKSKRQTTPRIVKNPQLTPRGWLNTKNNSSYKYDLPESLANRHLYWDNTKRNKQARVRNSQRKHYRLGISHTTLNGQQTYARPLPEILKELSDVRILKASLGRVFENIDEIKSIYPHVLESPDKAILVSAVQQIHNRSLPILTSRQFWKLCRNYRWLHIDPTNAMFTHFYKYIEADSWNQAMLFNPYILNYLCFVFLNDKQRKKYPEQFDEMFYRKPVEFKLFEDCGPAVKPLVELVPKIYSDQNIREIKSSPRFTGLQQFSNFKLLPGGQLLLDRFNSVQLQP